MGKILDNIRDKYYPESKIVGTKDNCLVTNNNTVIKETRYGSGMAKKGFHGHGNQLHVFTFHNELHWLNLLKESGFTPKLVSYDKSLLTIEMTYVGQTITKENIPSNWKDQCEHIIATLKSYNCSHNDIKPEDILVDNETLYLVDFGWATTINADIPTFWPESIGGDFKYQPSKFNDEYSLISSINYVLEK